MEDFSRKTLVFVHVPKTAGSTLHQILEKEYKRVFHVDGLNAMKSLQEFKELTPQEQNSFGAVKGHLTLRLLNSIDNPFVITYLRDPVDLFLSQYYYVKRAKRSKYHQEVKNMDDINQFIEFVKEKGYDNIQTRHLSDATLHITDAEILPVNMDVDGEKYLTIAKQNLEKFDLVFDTTQFDKSLIVLYEKLKWKKYPYYLAKNVTKKRKKTADLSNDLFLKINELNRYDMALYEYAKNLDNNLSDIIQLDKKVETFISRNRWYQKIAFPIRQLKLKLSRFKKSLLSTNT